MTADLDPTATGLIERSAAAYVSGVPEDAADDGLFGPASVAWRVSADLASPVAGLRSADCWRRNRLQAACRRQKSPCREGQSPS